MSSAAAIARPFLPLPEEMLDHPNPAERRCLSREDARALAQQNERLACSMGMTVEELAESWEISVSLDHAIELGWITADDKRLMGGRATREELQKLRELGYSPEELGELVLVNG